MLNNPGAEALMQDARDAYAKAEALLAAGDWRDAAEKGWLAVRSANIALVWAVTGVHNRTSTQINAGLRKLAQERGGQYVDMNKRCSRFAHNLHSQAFYNGFYHHDLPDFIREVADYIRLAQQLAETDA